MRPDQMQRAKKLDVRVDAQTSFLWDKAAVVAKFLGKDTADRAFPMRTMIDIMGLKLIGQGTDYPINLLNPFVNMYVMVTRRDKNGDVYGEGERISRKEAIQLYTSAASRYSFSEDKVGSIEPGKYADMVVLSDDIMTIPEESIKDITAVRTIVGGERSTTVRPSHERDLKREQRHAALGDRILGRGARSRRRNRLDGSAL